MGNAFESVKLLDTSIEMAQFGVASAPTKLKKVWSFTQGIIYAMWRNVRVGKLQLAWGTSAYQDPEKAQLIIQEAGFQTPLEVAEFIWSGKSVYEAWEKAKQEQNFDLMIPAIEQRFAMAREIGRRRIAAHNHFAPHFGWGTITSISESFNQVVSGIRASDLHPLIDQIKAAAIQAYPKLKEAQADSEIFKTMPRDFFNSLSAEEKMAILQMDLQSEENADINHIQIKRTENAMAQGYVDKIGIGVNPEESFIVFWRAWEHERRHAKYRARRKNHMLCASRDEAYPHVGDDGLPMTQSRAIRIIECIKAVVGEERMPAKLKPDHIIAAMQSVQDEDMSHYPPYPLYALYQAVLMNTEARMLDEDIPARDLPAIYAEEYKEIFGSEITLEEAKKECLKRFQLFYTHGRTISYVANAFANPMFKDILQYAREGKREDNMIGYLDIDPSAPFDKVVRMACGHGINYAAQEFLSDLKSKLTYWENGAVPS